MSDVIRAIEDSFRGLLRNKRYRSVTVKDICEQAHISRKTFYANSISPFTMMGNTIATLSFR